MTLLKRKQPKLPECEVRHPEPFWKQPEGLSADDFAGYRHQYDMVIHLVAEEIWQRNVSAN